MYKVQILYTSKAQAQFKLSVGTYKEIQEGKAPTLQARLPEAVSVLDVQAVTAAAHTSNEPQHTP